MKFLQLQNDYLKARVEEKGIVTLTDIPPIEEGLSLWQGDIVHEYVKNIKITFTFLHNMMYN